MLLTPLSRLRLAGRLCRVGAGFIAAIGVTISIFFFLVNTTANSGPTPGPDSQQVLTALAVALGIDIFVFFCAIFLYAVSAFLEYIAARDSTEPESDEQDTDMEHVEIKSIRR